MSVLRNRLLLLAVTTGLALAVLPAAVPAAQGVAPRLAQSSARTVTLELSRDSVKVGGAFDATGTLTDAPEGTKVRLQRGTEGSWVTVATTQTTSAAGAFALKKVTASKTGAFLYRAVVPGSGSTGPASSDYTWLVVTAKHPPKIVSGYVQAGGPVAGSTVLIYLHGRTKPLRTTTSTNGYFLTRVPTLPKSLLVVATGGTGPIGKFHGTMTAIVEKPTTHDSFYVNPPTTLMAAYMTIHPRSTHARAWAKIRNLLGLRKYHNLDWALGGRPTYFDSVKFLRTAKRHGGFDAYVARLVRRIDREGASASFRRTDDATAAPAARATRRAGESPVAGLIGAEAAGYLGVAAQGASVINAGLGLMNLVGGLVGWSPSGATSPAQILTAIEQVQTTLSAIETQIANLQADLQDDFSALQLTSDQNAYNNAVQALGNAYVHVTNVQQDYADYVSNEALLASGTSTPQQIATATTNQPLDLADYRNDIKILENDLSSAGDVFHGALLPGPQSTTPALSFLVDRYLDTNGQLFLPSGSSLVQNFTAKVLTSQAWAYYLIVTYEMSLVPPGTAPDPRGTIVGTSGAYLGSDYATWPQFASLDDPPTTPTAAPTSGNLHAEMSYLQSVLPVPEWMAVDTTSGGRMFMTTSNVRLASTYLPADAAARDDCVAVEDFNGGDWVCTALMSPLNQLNADMTTFAAEQGALWAADATQGEPPGTYWSGLQTGWNLVLEGDLAAILPRLAGANDVDAQYYFNPGPAWYGENDGYWVHSDGWTVCADSVNGQSPDCLGSVEGVPVSTYLEPVTDWMKLYFKLLDGSDFTCTWAVGQANGNTDQCFDMPALIARPLQPGEVYVPSQ